MRMIVRPGTRTRAAGLVLAAFAAVAGGQAARAACSVGKLAELSVTMQGRRPMTSVQINGHNLNLIVDNGRSLSQLNSPLADELKLSPHVLRNWRIKSAGEDNRLQMATVDVSVAGTTMPGVDFVVAPMLYANGAIGRNVLNVSGVEYDLAKGVVRLFKTTGCENTDMAYWANGSGFFTVDTRFMPERLHPVILEAQVNGQPVKVMFDTGAPTSSLSFAAAERLGLRRDGPGVQETQIEVHEHGKIERAWLTPIGSFKIGDEEIASTRLLVGPSARDIDMLLGADFFLAHHVYWARDQNRLYLTYNGGPVFDSRGQPFVIEPVDEGAPSTGHGN